MPRHMPPQTGTQTAGQSPVAEQRPCLVLLAEDNEVNALVATNFLELIGAVTEHVKMGARPFSTPCARSTGLI